MKFAIPFVRQFKYFDEPIELNIKYKPKAKELDAFVEKYGTHRINFICEDLEFNRDFSIYQALKEKYPESNIVFCLKEYHKQIDEEFNKNNIPHYYNQFATNWDVFQGFLNLNVTDIFVAENLMFEAKNLSLNAKKNGKSLRSFCNVCESAWDDTPSLKTFFVRPEDIFLYEEYIDTFEFYLNDVDATRVNTMYEIYAKDKKWFGRLDEIIIGYKGDEDSRYIIPTFGEKRLNCQKKCMKGIEPTCHICDRVAELGKTLQDRNLMVTLEK